MKTPEEILRIFEDLETIEPSADWKNSLSDKINNSFAEPGTPLGQKILLGLVGLVLVGNIFTYYTDLAHSRRESTRDKYRTIASELLISTTSSKF